MRSRPEQALHRQVAQFLDLCLGDTAWWSTFPAGGGGLMRGKILASLGLKPGVPDILVINDGRAFFIELKAIRGRLSASQYDTIDRLLNSGCQTCIARSLDDVIDSLRFWKVPLKLNERAA